MSTSVSFLGGTGAVTGAHFLLNSNGFLYAVDCGLRQDFIGEDDPNRDPFPYNPKELQVLLVTHAHMDHIGRIPKLVKDEFAGSIYSTPATRAIASLMLDDALSLMLEAAEKSGEEPLFTAEDVKHAFSLWKTEDYHSTFRIGEDISVRFLDAGHILGSAIIELTRGGKKLVFSGDLGNTPDPIVRDTEMLSDANYLIMESVYGDRVHEARNERRALLRQAIEDTRSRRGVLLIPVFSLHRTQEILYEINSMVEDGELQPIDMYLDSPLAIRVTDVYREYAKDFNETARARMQSDADLFSFTKLTETLKVADSKTIEHSPNPKVILAGSGMSFGGRVQRHEKHFLGDKDTTLLLVGYQTPGSPGRRVLEGAKKVRIDGEWVRVRAHIESITGYSGHKDRDQLIEFVENTASTLEKVFVTMGEPKSALFLTQRLRDFLGVDAVAPAAGQTFEIEF